MKIKFTDLPTSGGKIQVSFDGGVSFNDYNVEDVQDTCTKFHNFSVNVL